MYDEFMATSSSKLDELLNSARDSKKNIKTFMNTNHEIRILGRKIGQGNLSKFTNGVINGAIDDIANELTDNIIENAQDIFNLDEQQISEFHAELVNQFKQGIVSIATQF